MLKNKILNPNLLSLGLGECAGPHLGVDGFIPVNPLQALASTLVLVFLSSDWSYLNAL